MTETAQTPGDPFEVLRKAYEQSLEAWSKTMEQLVTSDEFASASGLLLRRYVELQERIREASRTAAESFHLPTTDDLARIAQLVANVERKVDEVSDEAHAVTARVEALAQGLAPVAALDARIVSLAEDVRRVAARVAALDARIEELAARAVTPAPTAPAPTAPAATPSASAPATKAAPKVQPARRRTQAATKSRS